jgi:o-succinylbenzoate---CoA ligase
VVAQLRAVLAPRHHAAAAYARVWEAGDAVLPLPVDAPGGHLDELLASQRPASITEVDAQGQSTTRSIAGDAPVHDDAALVITTSGSTGQPKGVVLTHTALRASVDASIARLGCVPGDRWALALPTHHVAGITVLLRARALGTEPVIVGTHDLPRSPGTAEHVSLVPTQLHRLLEQGADVAGFRTILLGGAAAGPDLLARARARGATVVTSYGMTETCGGCVYDGRALEGVEVALRDDGRIRLRGPVLFHGYRGDATDPANGSTFDADGWFTTSDLGAVTPDGHLEVLGRADDVVVTGGENVPIPVVAEALSSHPAVAEVAVAGRADPEWGSVVVAVVVPTDPSHPPTLDTLREHLRDTLPRTHAPQALRIVAGLPRDPMGKLTRAAVARLAAETD